MRGPRAQAGDELPRTPAGVLVAVADRLDSLVGLCAAGCAPSASADPFGLRRWYATPCPSPSPMRLAPSASTDLSGLRQ